METSLSQHPQQTRLSIKTLKGVGPRVAERLQRLGIRSVQDVLFHLPLRYEDRTRIVPIGSLRPGDRAVIQGEVLLTEVKYAKRRMLLTRIADGSGSISLRFFHFSASQQAGLARGVTLRCFGEVRRNAKHLEIIHPEYQRVDLTRDDAVNEHLTPIYPTTEGLHQLSWRSLTDQALVLLQQGRVELAEWLPAEVLAKLQLPTLIDSLLYIHRPPPDAPVEMLSEGRHSVQQRLAFDELLAHTLSLRKLRVKTQHQSAPGLKVDGELSQRFVKQLPFKLTHAQQRVVAEIGIDLVKSSPMQRLVQGDVGSGKTVVAALAALYAVESGFQAAIMAPTELLAEQHYRNFSNWLQPLDIEVTWLSGKLTTSERKSALERLAKNNAHVIVGTHALFQEQVSFANLALIVVDEQHRFGVHQRLALREKGVCEGKHPHQLIMTATPIPRTLTMTAYADLDCSIIDELPPGRKPVETVVMPDARREEIVQRVQQACRDHRQVYWVCTLIEESEVLQCQAAEDTVELLSEVLAEFNVGLLHGRMKPTEKEQVMQAFKEGEIDLLVATTVIEVGVDVPNASLMIIENAERLGLAQLHQLRGRVGRGSRASCCLLMYHGPLSENAKTRLGVMRETNDGFVIAEKDLELRGPGEVLGTRQTGMLQLRIADIQRDQALLPKVTQVADTLLRDYPDRVAPLIHRWIGEATQYADV